MFGWCDCLWSQPFLLGCFCPFSDHFLKSILIHSEKSWQQLTWLSHLCLTIIFKTFPALQAGASCRQFLHSVRVCMCMSYVHRSLFVEGCAAMRVNEYVSQLSFPPQSRWAEVGTQLQARVTVKKRGGSKIDWREQNCFLKTKVKVCWGWGH